MNAVPQTITTVRHAQTGHNVKKIISGRLDEPLSEAGRALACEMRETLGRLDAGLIVTSTACRAIETASLLTDCDASAFITSELCLERDYGELQGIPPEAVDAIRHRIEYVEVGGILHSLNPPGGESFESVRGRAVAFRDFLRARPERSVLVVSHQVFLQQLHGLLLGLGVRESLALDIRSLQVDRFDVDAHGSARHCPVHPGLGQAVSW